MAPDRPPRILVADDDQSFRKPLAELLRREGTEVIEVVDASHALEILDQTEIDLLVSDIRMPGNVELELIKRVARYSGGLPVILLTGFPEVRTAAAAVQLPVVAYLTKPPAFSELWSIAQKAIARRRDHQAIVATRERVAHWMRELETVETQLKSAPKADDHLGETASALLFRNALESLMELKQFTDRHASPAPSPENADAALSQAVKQTIAVLEQTKQNFKSKRLADLRKHLEDVLGQQKSP